MRWLLENNKLFLTARQVGIDRISLD